VRIRTIIADDEELARRGLRALSQRSGDLDVICECRNGRETVEAIRRSQPDLVFLDVQMPGRTGFDVINAIADIKRPHIVFVTAYDKFALRAFEVHALDYLLKPVNEERFDAALTHVRAAMSIAADKDIAQRVRKVAADLPITTSPVTASAVDRLAIKDKGRIVVVRVTDIDWIEAAGDYVSVHVGGKTWLMRETIAAIELRLALSGFVRIHRSVLVNVDRVAELQPQEKGEYAVLLRDGTELKLTRSYHASVERLVSGNL
jgi:two-component system, LytTR family, response regulator